MNDIDFSQEELVGLLDDLCNGTLEGDRHLRLQAILHASESARATYLDFIDLHVDMKRVHAQSGDLSADATSVLTRIHASNTVAVPAKWRLTTWLATWAALAASLLVGMGIAWFVAKRGVGSLDRGTGRRTSQDLAVSSDLPVKEGSRGTHVLLTQISRVKFFGEVTPALGSSVQVDHEYALCAGIIELSFPSGATTIIEAPAIFKVPSTSRLLLSTGTCSVYAPPGAQGFRVDTPLANIVDLGTRFVVKVTQSGETAVQVVEGEAEVYPKSSQGGNVVGFEKPINLHQHQASLIGGQANVDPSEIITAEHDYMRILPDRVLEYEAVEDANGAVDELLAVSLQRGGVERRYEVSELIGIDLIYYRSDVSNAFMLLAAKLADPKGDLTVDRSRTETLDRDRSLCSGIINPGGSRDGLLESPVLDDPKALNASLTPGFGIRFQAPVINSVGPDVVFFEFQKIIDPESGDPFHVSPLDFKPGLHTYTVKQYDINLVSPQARFVSPIRLFRCSTLPGSVSQLDDLDWFDNRIHIVPGKVMAVGIDLSDLGYEPGACVEGLFFQDILDDANYIDPVFIAGLPIVP